MFVSCCTGLSYGKSLAECQKAVDLETNAPRIVSVCADIVPSHLVGQDMGTPRRVEDNIPVVTNNENENVTNNEYDSENENISLAELRRQMRMACSEHSSDSEMSYLYDSDNDKTFKPSRLDANSSDSGSADYSDLSTDSDTPI